MVQSSSTTRHRPPTPAFPKQQLIILALCRICEPIAFMSIFPYIYYMIKSFRITANDREIAVYAGMVTSAFALAEFSTSVLWGRLSDRLGRKPILLTGLAGTGLSMLVFGFATNLPLALLGRALGGLLNGNIGVLQTTVAEVVTVEEHRPRAYAIMPFVWCLGSIIGSGIGGSLADPVTNYPTIFSRGSIFESYPYLLPNLVSAAVVLFGLFVGIFFLEETLESKRDRRDPGLEIGQIFLTGVRHRTCHTSYSKQEEASSEETTALIEDNEQPPTYDPLGRGCPVPEVECKPVVLPSADAEIATGPSTAVLACTRAFTSQVMLNVLAYGILAYHTIAFEQLLPVLLSMDTAHEPARSWFKFLGGFGLPSSTIGHILSLQGIYQMFAQMVLFPAIVRRFGPLTTFRLTALTYPLLYLMVPYLALLPEQLRMPGLFAVLLWKVTHQALAYPSNMLLLTNAAPSLLVLGVVNGVAASAASLSRALGPTLSGLIQSAGLDVGYLGIPWWATSGIATIGSVVSLWLQDRRRCDITSTTSPAESKARLHDDNRTAKGVGYGEETTRVRTKQYEQ